METLEIEIAPPLREVERLLWVWADWMQHGGRIARGYPQKTSYFITGGKNNSDDFERDNDITAGKIMDSIINDLPKKEQAAIRFCYTGQRYCYDSDGFEYVDTLRKARLIVEEKAKKKGLIH